MKIAIPVDENKTEVCVSFGRAPFYLFHDTGAGETVVKENPAAEVQGGAGIKAAQFLVDEGAEVLITVRCGENAAEVMKEAEIRIYRSEGSSAAQNLTLFQQEKLAPLTHFHAGFHGAQ